AERARTGLLPGARRAVRRARARRGSGRCGGASGRRAPEAALRVAGGGGAEALAAPVLRKREILRPCAPTIPAPRGTGVSVTRRSPKPQREVRLLGSPLLRFPANAGNSLLSRGIRTEG